MGFPSYKINNSYTVYANYIYLNDCIRAGKKHSQKKKKNDENAKSVRKVLHSQIAPPQRNSGMQTCCKHVIHAGSTVHLLNMDSKKSDKPIQSEAEIAIKNTCFGLFY